MFIEELGRELVGRNLDIYEGRSGLSEAKRQRYIAIWRKTGTQPEVATPEGGRRPRKTKWDLVLAPECPYRGEDVVATGECRTCGGAGRAVELHTCSQFDTKCYVGPYDPPRGIGRSCMRCPVPREIEKPVPPPVSASSPISRRNLLYHVYPRRGGDWRTPVNRLRGRIDLFDGSRTVAISYDDTTESPAMVEDALSGLGVAFLRVPNDPNLREVATFLPLFETVSGDADPGSVTMYGHAKGVTRKKTQEAVPRWANALSELCLDYWPAVEDLLRVRPVVGPFKKVGRAWPHASESDWHFSGSWFWFRNSALFGKSDWRRIDQFWSGIEPYPSLHFSAAEAGDLFGGGRMGGVDLYSVDYWNRVVEPSLAQFRETNQSRRTGLVDVPDECEGLNLGCGPHYREGWMNVDCSPSVRSDAVVAAGAPLPFRSGSFRRAYLGHVLEHVRWEDCLPLLAEVKRVVAPGGVVCCVGPDVVRAVARAIESGGAESDMRHVAECGEWQEFGEVPGRDHRWACSEKRLTMLLDRAGFAGVRTADVSDLAESWPVVSLDGAQCGATGVSR